MCLGSAAMVHSLGAALGAAATCIASTQAFQPIASWYRAIIKSGRGFFLGTAGWGAGAAWWRVPCVKEHGPPESAHRWCILASQVLVHGLLIHSVNLRRLGMALAQAGALVLLVQPWRCADRAQLKRPCSYIQRSRLVAGGTMSTMVGATGADAARASRK